MRATSMVSGAALALVLAATGGGIMVPQAAIAATAPVKTYTAAQFLETRNYRIGGFAADAFSHDGKSLLISSDQTGTFNAYALPLAGGAPKPLTASTTDATYAVSAFPNDDRVLVTHDGGGNELNHIYVRDADGTLKDLTPGEKLKADFAGWAADGKTFYLTSNARDPKAFDLYAYDVATLAPKLVFQNDGGFRVSGVSPDGTTVALVKSLSSKNSDVYVASLSGGAPKLMTPHKGDVSYNVSDFTPDSKGLIILSDEDGEFARGIAYDIASGAKKELTRGDWDVVYTFYSPKGRYRLSALNADASSMLTIVDTKTGQPLKLTGIPAGDLGAPRFNADETMLAFTVASDTSPSDIFVADVATGKARRLTHALNPAIAESDLVEATVVRYAGEGGVQVPGILYKPKGASVTHPVPAIVYVHGGPGGQSRRGYSASIQHLVNHGYAVLAANNRGSSGYGKTFFHMDDRHHGEADLRDIVAGGAWFRSQPWVAKDKVAVMGGSYGGYMTAAALTFHPDAFAAGVDIFGVTNWERTLKSIPPWWGAERIALFDEMGDPATDGVRHHAISPLFHAARITKPLLVIQGKNDPRVLQVESDELVAAVRANKVPVEYVVFPDEGHGFQSRKNRVTAQEAYLKFLDQYVRK
ncbi:alpha/beta fold hydrolase [Sphingomonas naphthae]|uniref:Alpha/beta fold hydrolase n=1 Tax=Sphingomonas naphthae TaxID=1813468 RepID=A0ABY7TIE7_9SPHN|nr:alpha/beta fold hydrolase [Sphingomonas naphthae]WCT72889.1 alpha/beta fold hydrolase [Sphingomonas naphthae]